MMNEALSPTPYSQRPWHAKLMKSQPFLDAIYILLGALFQAIGYSIFIAPANIVPGGVYGITIALNHLTKGMFSFAPEGFPIGITALFFNVPLLLLALKKLGISSAGKTVATFLLISLFTDFISSMTKDMGLIGNDRLLSAFYGGAIIGVGVYLIFKAGSTSAGTDVLSRVIASGRNFKLSDTIIVIDSIVVVFGLIAFGDWTVPLYSWLTIIVYGQVVNFLQPENPKRAVFIVSSKIDEIKEALVHKLGVRGTLIKGRGMYMDEEREIIFTIVERKKLPILKDCVKSVDYSAFISTMDASHDMINQPSKP